MKRLLLAGSLAVALFARSAVARADCGLEDGGACAVNTYCGFEDGGTSDDASAGSCLAQPCVLAADCETDGGSYLCDTSRVIFQCVQCISTADCPGVLVCDPATRTCVNPPPVPDAGEDTGAPSEDAAAPEDAAVPPDAGIDASVHDSGVALVDASDAAAPAVYDAGPSPGSLAGGACDCDVARPEVGMGAAGVPVIVGLLFGLRRRSRRRG